MTTSLAPFQVQCPSCRAEYPVDPDRVPPGGIHAVCSGCLRTFPVEVPAGLVEDAPAEAFDEAPDPAPDGAAVDTGDAAPGWSWEGGPAAEGPAADAVEVEPAPSPDVGEAGPSPAVEDAPAAASEQQDAPPAEEEDRSEDPLEELRKAFAWDRDEAAPEDTAAPEAPSTPAAPPEAEPIVTEPPASRPEPHFHDLSGLTDEALAEQARDEEGPREAVVSRGEARFGRRDPHDRARRLARVLVSDIIAYYPDKHSQAVREGRVKEVFEGEVQKSWKEYVDQVGSEIAESTPYFREALNEVLARGRQIY